MPLHLDTRLMLRNNLIVPESSMEVYEIHVNKCEISVTILPNWSSLLSLKKLDHSFVLTGC